MSSSSSDSIEESDSKYSRGVLIVIALGWGLLSSVSFLLGATVGILKPPGTITRAVLMAFGGGALIQAVAVELFGELLVAQAEGHVGSVEACWTGIGCGLFGAMLSYTVTKVLNDSGAFVRNVNTVRGAATLLKRATIRKLVKRLRSIPSLAVLSQRQLEHLAKAMVKENFKQGQPIIGVRSEDVGVYFVSSGAVQVAVYPHAPGDDVSESSKDKGATQPEHHIVTKDKPFGDMTLLVGRPATVTATALIPTKAIFLPQAAIDDVLHGHHSVIDRVVPARVLGWCGIRRVTPRLQVRSRTSLSHAANATAGRSLSGTPRANNTNVRALNGDNSDKSKPGAISTTPSSSSLTSNTANNTANNGDTDLILVATETGLPHVSQLDHQLASALSALGWLTQAEADANPEIREQKKRTSFSMIAGSIRGGSSFSSSIFRGSFRGGNNNEEEHMPIEPNMGDAAQVAQVLDHGGTVEGALAEELREEVHEHVHGKMGAIIIWLGMCIDGIPESFVLGVLTNGIPDEYPSLIGFCAAVAIANFPEAMSCSAVLRACGMPIWKIIGMWFIIFFGTGFGAAFGAALFPADGDEFRQAIGIAVIYGLCGGATLTMVVNTVVPEAYELGGDIAGFGLCMGFLTAMIIKSVGLSIAGVDDHESCAHAVDHFDNFTNISSILP